MQVLVGRRTIPGEGSSKATSSKTFVFCEVEVGAEIHSFQEINQNDWPKSVESSGPFIPLFLPHL